MTIQQFFLEWNSKPCDFDHAYSTQCMDIYQQYNKDVVDAPIVPSNAIDVINKYPKTHYDFIANTPTNFPQLGDVILWTNGVGTYGHIAICFTADINHFVCFEQNYPIGSLCHFGSHNYTNIAGWLRPKSSIIDGVPQDTTMAPITDQALLDLSSCGQEYKDHGPYEFQVIKSMIIAKDAEMKNLRDQIKNMLPIPPQTPQNALSEPTGPSVIVPPDSNLFTRLISWILSVFKVGNNDKKI